MGTTKKFDTLIRMALEHIKQRYSSDNTANPFQEAKDLAFLITKHIAPDKNLDLSTMGDTDINLMQKKANINNNEEMLVSSPLVERLLNLNILVGTILPAWNSFIPPTIFKQSNANINLYDISEHKYVYNKKLECLAIKFSPHNGNLLVSGEKQISIGEQTEYIRFSGVVNPRNLTINNTVNSNQIADARKEYKANGTISEAQVMGWPSRFFLTVLPF